MTIDNAYLDNDLFYQPEDRYWENIEKLSWELAHLETEWPSPMNPFIGRMASLMKEGRSNQNLGIDDFKHLIGALIKQRPNVAFRFMVIPMGPSAKQLTVCLLQESQTVLAPIASDNCCSIAMAIKWMATNHSHFEVSCAESGAFWVHKQ